MEELEKIANASYDMMDAFDKWLATDNADTETAHVLADKKNKLALMLNAYFDSMKNLKEE